MEERVFIELQVALVTANEHALFGNALMVQKPRKNDLGDSKRA